MTSRPVLSRSVLGGPPLLSAGGGEPLPYAALRLADFTQFEPGGVGTFLSAPPEDQGGNGGWAFSVLGGAGKSVSDPFDGWHAIGPVMKTVTGSSLSATQSWSVACMLAERVAMSDLSGDIQIMMGICNEASDSASIRAGGHGVLATGGARGGRKVMVIAGAATFVGGATSNNIRYAPGYLSKTGMGAASVVIIHDGRLLDTNRAPLANNYNTGQQDATAWGDVAPRLWVAVHRTAVTAGTVTLTFQPYAQPVSPHGAIPA